MNTTVFKASWRPLNFLVILLAGFALVNTCLIFHAYKSAGRQGQENALWEITTAALGLTDLCVATEARYTRNPAVTDSIVPFMDHPGAIEHFPTGSFWAPPPSVAHLTGRDR